ncbi:MAG: DUF4919 domain-containing protein [Blastocatellia bacterium]
MKTKLTILFLCLSVFAFGVLAQQPAKDAKDNKDTKEKVKEEKIKADEAITIKSKVSKEDYEELFGKLKKGDTAINFAKMRLAYTETKDYSPYGGGPERGDMYKAYREADHKAALAIAKKLLETNYVDVSAHFICWKSNAKLENKTDAEFHEKVYNGLMAAIQQNDGLSAKTAMISIGISEQYFVMGQMGYSRQSKALTQENGSMFDVHTSINSSTQETRKFYFNIDKVFGKF